MRIIHWARGLKAIYLGNVLWLEWMFGGLIVTVFRKRIYDQAHRRFLKTGSHKKPDLF